MSGGQQAENTMHENAIGWGILLVILALLIWLFWHSQDELVRNIIRWVRYGEMWVIEKFLWIGGQIGLHDGKVMVQSEKGMIDWYVYYHSIPKWDKAELTNALGLISDLTMRPLQWIFVGVCGLGALWSIFRGPQAHYRSRLGLEGLIQRQASNFPVISPFVEFNPSLQPPRPPGSPVPAELPPFAEALGPEEWLAYTGNTAKDGKVDEAMAAKAFQKQLIGRWKGWKSLEPYQQVMLAAFCLKASRKRDASDHMLGRLAMCWNAKGGLKLGRDKKLLGDARKVLKSRKLAQGTLEACNKHAFVTTALLGALNFARNEGGVLAPAQFVWLRAHERRLWYPLNNLGRHSYHMEAFGAMSHFKAERLTMRPIPVPKMEGAVQSISDYMKSKKARPIPQMDYSQSKKRGIKKAT